MDADLAVNAVERPVADQVTGGTGSPIVTSVASPSPDNCTSGTFPSDDPETIDVLQQPQQPTTAVSSSQKKRRKKEEKKKKKEEGEKKAARVVAFQRSLKVRHAVKLQMLGAHRLARPDANLVDWESLARRYPHVELSEFQENWAREFPAEDVGYLWEFASFRQVVERLTVNCENGECVCGSLCRAQQPQHSASTTPPSRTRADAHSDEDDSEPESGTNDPAAMLRQPRALTMTDEPCRLFRMGRCRRVANCRYSH